MALRCGAGVAQHQQQPQIRLAPSHLPDLNILRPQIPFSLMKCPISEWNVLGDGRHKQGPFAEVLVPFSKSRSNVILLCKTMIGTLPRTTMLRNAHHLTTHL